MSIPSEAGAVMLLVRVSAIDAHSRWVSAAADGLVTWTAMADDLRAARASAAAAAAVTGGAAAAAAAAATASTTHISDIAASLTLASSSSSRVNNDGRVI
jgi:hypothetical protein